MSEPLTCTKPDVLTGHTELISSTSIERIVTGRNAALERIKAMIHQLADISALYEDEYLSIRYFQKGSGHITFKRPDLVDKMNDIIAKHYPGVLTAL